MLSVLDYGLRLTTMSQIDLPKMDRVENDEPLVILGTSRDTLIVTKPVMLELAPMQIRQTADQVKADLSVVEIPHNPLRAAGPHLLNSGALCDHSFTSSRSEYVPLCVCVFVCVLSLIHI